MRRVLCTLIALASLATSTIRVESDMVVVDRTDENAPILVAMGDSYSSGEGNKPMYQDLAWDERVDKNDWLCHRSEFAWPYNLTYTDGTITKKFGDGMGSIFFFTAASSAKSYHIDKEEQSYTYCKNKTSSRKDVTVPKQIDVFEDNNLYGKVDFVTLTIGGNDIGFGGVVTAATVDPLTNWTPGILNPHILDDKLDDAWDKYYEEARDSIKESYMDIYYEAGPQATIIVAGYPALLSESKNTKWYSSEQGERINANVKLFNEELAKLVAECQDEGVDIQFVDVYDAFVGHEAMTSEPYINGVVWRNDCDINQSWLKVAVSSYSFHPNELGQQKYGERVQEVIDREWERKCSEPEVSLEDAYKAYKDLLQRNSSLEEIDSTDDSFLDTENCLLRDLTGDGAPELITVDLISGDSGFIYNIYSFDSQKGIVRRVFTSYVDDDNWGGLMGISHSHQGELVLMRIVDSNLTWTDNDRGTNALMYEYNVYSWNGSEFTKDKVYKVTAYEDDDVYMLDNELITKEEYELFADKFWNNYTPLMSVIKSIDEGYFKPLEYGDFDNYIVEAKSTTYDKVLLELDG